MDGGGRELLSLIRKGTGRAGAQHASGHSRAGDRVVLPRPVRFAVRHLSRIVDTAAPAKAGTGSLLAIGFLVISISYGVYQGGYGDAVMSSAASTVGLKVDAIRISGQVETEERDVLQALDLDSHGALLGLDLNEARARVVKLPWVEQVAIRKLFPGTLEVSIVEKKPFAVWQRDEKLNIIEGNGAVISRIEPDSLSVRHAMLPQIIGEGAEKRAARLFDLVSQYPSIVSRVDRFVRVADRRWNIMLRNNVVIELPEYQEDAALAAVVKMDRERQLLSRAISVVDMRLANRMVLRLTPEAAEKRRISVKERAKRMRRAEKSI